MHTYGLSPMWAKSKFLVTYTAIIWSFLICTGYAEIRFKYTIVAYAHIWYLDDVVKHWGLWAKYWLHPFEQILLIASITVVRFLFGVYPLMPAKLTFLHKHLTAFITFTRLLSSVSPHMHGKDTFIYKLLIAYITMVRNLPSVKPGMLDKNIFWNNCLLNISQW